MARANLSDAIQDYLCAIFKLSGDDEALGFPTRDPHGDPIPDANLEWPESS